MVSHLKEIFIVIVASQSQYVLLQSQGPCSCTNEKECSIF